MGILHIGHPCLQANQLIIAALVQPGDHVVVMEPAYRQVTSKCSLASAACACHHATHLPCR
jgi:aspartate/methionine/tyrosine aminotransferase